MIDKIVPTPAEALADVPDGATEMIGGFGITRPCWSIFGRRQQPVPSG
jgi:acyl CoA:acetate/3-ketoacid CoA transferase alpha subunit